MSEQKPVSDEAFLLELLQDKREHSVEEINMKSEAERGKTMTVHSRVAKLRMDGWVITARKIRQGLWAYTLHGRRDGHARVKKKNGPIVQGYVYMTHVEDPHNDRICQIVDRAEPEGNIPMFVVEFTGRRTERIVAAGDELHPWFPAS